MKAYTHSCTAHINTINGCYVGRRMSFACPVISCLYIIALPGIRLPLVRPHPLLSPSYLVAIAARCLCVAANAAFPAFVSCLFVLACFRFVARLIVCCFSRRDRVEAHIRLGLCLLGPLCCCLPCYRGRRQPGPSRSVPCHVAYACFWLGRCLLGPLLLSPMLGKTATRPL